jgi:hypothetical protein
LRNLALPVRQPVGRPGVPPKAAPRSPEPPNTTLSEIEAKGQIQPFSDIFLDDLDEKGDDDDKGGLVNSRRPSALDLDEDDEDYGDDDDSDDTDDGSIGGIKVQKVSGAPANRFGVTPQTREVDFRQLKQAASSSPSTTPNASPKAKPAPAPEKAEAPAPRVNRQAFAALASWVSDGVEKVGKERTTQIVETYAAGGKLSAETKASLLQLISLADDIETPKPVGSQEMLALMVGLDTILSGE